MADLFPKPSNEDVLAALQDCFPKLAIQDVSVLSEGWDSWAYEASGCIFRIPKHDYTLRSQARERLLMPAIAPLLPVPVPDMEFTCESGPNGHPFVGYRRIPGVPLSELPGFRAPEIGARLGRFLKALHSIPVRNLEAFVLEDADQKSYGAGAVERFSSFYERVTRQVFPLISSEAREATREAFEAFLSDESNFAYEPSIVHGDLGGEHLLVDPEAHELTGVIDFGDATLGDPAADFASVFAGSIGEVLGPEGVREAVEAYGPEAEGFERRARFYYSLFPYHAVIGGIELKDAEILESGLRSVADLTEGRQPCR